MVFLDLTAAYDTLNREALLLKLASVIPCLKILRVIEELLSNRHFYVVIGNKSSRWRTLNNGLPQGSVLAFQSFEKLFNLFTHDFPDTKSTCFKFADDIAMGTQGYSTVECENSLNQDLEVAFRYFKDNGLIVNPSKSQSTFFTLNTREASVQLNVLMNGLQIPHCDLPKYLGVFLDRTLTFNHHLKSCVW